MSGEMDSVMANFQRFAFQVKKQKTRNALGEILRTIGTESDRMVPVATGKLINSKFFRTMDTFFGMAGQVGYEQDYAVFVHEAPGIHVGRGTPRSPAGLGNLWDPNGEPKFLHKGAEKVMKFQINGILSRNYA